MRLSTEARRVLKILAFDLELQVHCEFPDRVLGTECRHLVRTMHALNFYAIFPAPTDEKFYFK